MTAEIAASPAPNPVRAVQATEEAIRGLLDGRDVTVRVVTQSAVDVALYVEVDGRRLTAAEARHLLRRLSCSGVDSYADAAGVTRMWGLRVVFHAHVYVGVVHA